MHGGSQGCLPGRAEVRPRVALVLKADIRPGWTGQLSAKVERVEARLRQDDVDGGDAS